MDFIVLLKILLWAVIVWSFFMVLSNLILFIFTLSKLKRDLIIYRKKLNEKAGEYLAGFFINIFVLIVISFVLAYVFN